ncbi:hypothetical protein P879_00820 [Paragonimus westermani]|uniref:Uncharacterized protein n=1 Tax=Paragonimus westermani TaxID=34504 RepID=A0A8T0DYG2_9TREM|nr:hypothetical protein P879_00820 [Paragonimus westermani]
MSLRELQDEVLSKRGFVNTSADGPELKLTRIRVQRLELQLALKDKMEEWKTVNQEDLKRLNEQIEIVILDHSVGKQLLNSPSQSSTSLARPHCTTDFRSRGPLGRSCFQH